MKVFTHMKEGASDDNFLVIISSSLVSCWESTLSQTTSVALAETYRCRRVRVLFSGERRRPCCAGWYPPLNFNEAILIRRVVARRNQVGKSIRTM